MLHKMKLDKSIEDVFNFKAKVQYQNNYKNN